MNRTMVATVAFALGSFASSAALAQEPAAARAEAAATEAAKLARMLKRSDEDGLRLFPQNGLWRGDMRRAGEFGDLITDQWIAANKASNAQDLAEIAAIDLTKLSPNDRMVFDVFRYQATLQKRYFDLGLAEIAARMPLDQLSGQHLTYPQIASGESVAPFKTIKDYEDGLTRLTGFALYLERCIGRMREGIAAGQVQSKGVTEQMIAQIDAVLAARVEDSDFYKPIKAFPDGIPAAERERLKPLYRDVIETRVFPAYRKLRAFMAAEYLPASRTGAPGLASLKGGERIYAWNLEQFTTTRMTPAEIHALGLKEVARIRREMEAVKTAYGFRGSLRAFFTHLATDPKFRFRSSEDMTAQSTALIGPVSAILPRYFGKLPKSKFEVRPIPAAQESSAGGAYFQVGTPDGARAGAIYLNTAPTYLATLPRKTALFLHEGMPGHHLQGSIAQEDTTLPEFIRFGYYLGHGEGWGLYSEWLGNEMGLYTDPIQRFGYLDMQLFRAQRLVVDTGLHAKGWTRQQAIDWILATSGQSAKEAGERVDRYTSWPGQATAYTIGMKFIQRLRAKSERRLGKRFDIRAFHDQVIGSGTLPLPALEARIDRWIASMTPG
jgi:uncharacterized protein (DUF885 family)